MLSQLDFTTEGGEAREVREVKEVKEVEERRERRTSCKNKPYSSLPLENHGSLRMNSEGRKEGRKKEIMREKMDGMNE
ncbi:hypothetical protein E2C01_098142 [Portunus trituberculatus]|uniref:Uncharacterized protein n=1 Tax=Portunus trituberculatus TaxID=210409 RepID=A0A5B7K284_PORTR|nr:hypothetical protein [Portunus trituberculatus]